jgi:hypothetical protein
MNANMVLQKVRVKANYWMRLFEFLRALQLSKDRLGRTAVSRGKVHGSSSTAWVALVERSGDPCAGRLPAVAPRCRVPGGARACSAREPAVFNMARYLACSGPVEFVVPRKGMHSRPYSVPNECIAADAADINRELEPS